jgi:hypothetical protein
LRCDGYAPIPTEGINVTSAPTVGEYRDRLNELLKSFDADLGDGEQDTLRAIVRERRFGRSQQLQSSASALINARANEIVAVLESAARVLRPRETQALDDFVAGVDTPDVAAPDYAPVRLRRRGL